jgi:hypothetical protein
MLQPYLWRVPPSPSLNSFHHFLCASLWLSHKGATSATLSPNLQIKRSDGSVEERFVNLTIIVKPGIKTGTKFAFPKQGDESPDSEPGT